MSPLSIMRAGMTLGWSIMLTLLETLPNALPTFTRYKTDDSLHAVKPMDFEAGRNLWPSIADDSKTHCSELLDSPEP
jgi:hypothetical protein